MNPVLIAQIKKPATYVTGFVARMGLEPMCARGVHEDFCENEDVDF
jgi:hypothetical protein